MSPVFRRRLLGFHLWAGLSAGLVLSIMAVAGAVMIFRPQLDPVVNRDLFAVEPGTQRVPLDTLAENAIAAYPGRTVNFVRFWSEPRLPAMIRCTNSDQIYLDPWTGRALGLQNRYRGFFGRAEDIHRFLGLGQTVGKQITGAAALLLLFIVVSGLLMWTRPVRRAPRAPSRGQGPARAQLLNAHKILGIAAGVVIFASAVTGLPHAYDWYEHALYRLSGSPLPEPPKPPAAPANAPRLPVEQLWQRVAEKVPQYHSANVYFPRGPSQVAEVWIVAANPPHPHARGTAFVDAVTGQLLEFTSYENSSLGHRIYYVMLSLHLGQWAGWPGQVILLLAVLCVPLLTVTGAWAYFKRRRARHAEPQADPLP
jgi:uncharacterized iron-regulated membrane protein